MPDDHEKSAVTGASLTSCGNTSCHCSPHANRTLWGAIGPASMIAKMETVKIRGCCWINSADYLSQG